MKLIPLLLFCFGILSPGTAPANSPAETFVQANQAYENGDPQTATRLYESLTVAASPLSGAGSAQVHYNLGNAYLRQEQLGKAIASYLRSLKENPINEDLLANLHYARSHTTDDVTPRAPGPVVRTLFFWHFILGHRTIIHLFLVVNLIFWGLLTARLYFQKEGLLWGRHLALAVLLALGGSIMVRVFNPQKVGVVQPKVASVYAGQSPKSVIRFKLHEGTEVEVVAEEDSWVRISLPDQKQGWIPLSDVAIISL